MVNFNEKSAGNYLSTYYGSIHIICEEKLIKKSLHGVQAVRWPSTFLYRSVKSSSKQSFSLSFYQ